MCGAFLKLRPPYHQQLQEELSNTKKDLIILMGGPDEPGEKHKLHLSPTFCCGIVFFDLKQEHQFSESALSKLIAGIELRGFFGGVVLRGEGHQNDVTGKLEILCSETPIESTIGKSKHSLFNFGITKSTKIADKLHLGAALVWSESNFSQFGFGVLAMMQGTYDGGKISSLYGIGSSMWDVANA